ncbi:MAG: DUF721 domain-containing protein [Candidatus Margulisbacteria bacterium]|nr:DUF721 domain-containing protein [Candidatus Margulisiibacteriota bacterium]
MTWKLSEILKEQESGVGRTIKLCKILSAWKEVVGEKIGSHTEAVKISHGMLFVSTSSPVWAQELSFLKDELMGKLNLVAGSQIIKDIRFRCGG